MVKKICIRCQREMLHYAKGMCVSCYMVTKKSLNAKQNSKVGRPNPGV